ncbi:PLP-dependent aminotransferase family protein [Streptomyces sp. NPDC088147]|uniref:aminotransferase-like domain-containing protein n=1 Tax=unclassified Streptomyces TaxID=2593676 RepID=UPI0033B49B78
MTRATVAVPGVRLHASQLHGSLVEPLMDSMNFLNEIANRYPNAVSFAPGRPYEGTFDSAALARYLERYRTYLATERGMSAEEVNRTLFQYGRTKGIIPELIARSLAVDEGIHLDDLESVVVTVGCQEAMFLVMRALRVDERDVLLTVAPTYVGAVGAARTAELPTVPVADGPLGVDLDDLARSVDTLRGEGRRPRALYVIPDYANPSGVRMDLATRRSLLDAAREHGLLLLEDNPYGLFHDGSRLPTLKALDTERRVVYLGSFAKTGLPGARVGFVVADQEVVRADGSVGLLADELAKIKGMVTVNTPPVAQAVIGGKLLEHGCSLVAANRAEREVYQDNLSRLLAGLARHFPPATGVRWNRPSGGFFVVVDVPFPADDALLEHSARRHGVLWSPMSHFDPRPEARNRLRLSFSSLSPELVETGLDRLHAMVTERLGAA